MQWDRWMNLWDPELNWMQWQREISPPHENWALVFHSIPRSHAVKYEQLIVQQAMHGVCLQAAFHSNYFWCKTHSKYCMRFEAQVFRCLGLRPVTTHLMPLLQSSVTGSNNYETVQLAGQIHHTPAVSQIPLCSVWLCLSLRKLGCFCAICNETFLQSFYVFYAFNMFVLC